MKTNKLTGVKVKALSTFVFVLSLLFFLAPVATAAGDISPSEFFGESKLHNTYRGDPTTRWSSLVHVIDQDNGGSVLNASWGCSSSGDITVAAPLGILAGALSPPGSNEVAQRNFGVSLSTLQGKAEVLFSTFGGAASATGKECSTAADKVAGAGIALKSCEGTLWADTCPVGENGGARGVLTSKVVNTCVPFWGPKDGVDISDASEARRWYTALLNGLSRSDFDSKVEANVPDPDSIGDTQCQKIYSAAGLDEKMKKKILNDLNKICKDDDKALKQIDGMTDEERAAAFGASSEGCDAALAASEEGEKSETSCAVDGIGWIICPVMVFMAKLNDAAFGFLNNFLEIQPRLVTDTATRTAWAAFRDIANVAFVIAFMVIVYSQLTSAGISNYGIKRMLPRLFIAAILVNVSFWICAVGVDISNIVGGSAYSLLKDTIDVGNGGGVDGGWTGLMQSILGAAVVGIGFVLLMLAVIMAPAALLAFAVILLILIARQAFVILLIVIAPLAFVAYLLPNTESWFKKWWKAFVAVLMVYPLVAVVFGASSLASQILMNVADDGANGGDDQMLLKIIALGVLAVPLFAVPLLLKASLSAAGSVGQRLSGFSDKGNRFAGRKIKEGRLGEAKAAIDRGRQSGRFKRRAGAGKLTTWGETKGGVLGKSVAWAGTRQKAFDNSGLGAKLGGTRGAAVATQGIHKQFDEDVSAFKTTLTDMSNGDLVRTLESGQGSDEYLAAVAGTIMSRDHRDSHVAALRVIGARTQKAELDKDKGALESVSNIQKQMSHDMKDKPWALGDQATGQLGNGTYGRSVSHTGELQKQYGDIDVEMKDRVGVKLSAQSLAGMNPDEMRAIHAMALGTHPSGVRLSQPEVDNLKAKIADLRRSRYKDDIKPEAKAWHDTILTLP